MPERQLSDVLARAIELVVPGVELVPVLRGPEREGRLGAEELVAVEPELVAEAAVDGADASVRDHEEPVGEGREERPSGVPVAVERVLDRAPGRAAEDEDERRGERQRERCGGGEPEDRLGGLGLHDPERGDGRGGSRDQQEQEILDAAAAQAHAVVTRALRSNLCQPWSPRRKRHVPLIRAHAMIGR